MIKKAISKCKINEQSNDYTFIKIKQVQLKAIVDAIITKKPQALLKSSYQIYLNSFYKYLQKHYLNGNLHEMLSRYKNQGKKFSVTILCGNAPINRDFREAFKRFLNDRENFRQFFDVENSNSRSQNKIIYPEFKDFYLNFVYGFENGTSMHLYSNKSIIEILAIIDRLKMMDKRLQDYL